MQESFWWWQCSDRYIISLFPHLHTPFPHFSPSLISLMVSVDVKHHVYLLTYARSKAGQQRGLGSNLLRLSFLSLQKLWFVDFVLWLCSPTTNETLTWLSSLLILIQESFWRRWQCSDKYIISPSPPSPISLVVSVDTWLLARSWRSCLCRSRDSLSSGRSTVQQYCVQFSPVPSKQSQKST